MLGFDHAFAPFALVHGAGLDLRPDATNAEIKRNFRKLAKQFHPDRNPGNADAEERFKLINESYEQLGDPDKRADYDRYLSRLQPKKTARRSTAWYDDFHPVDEQLRDFLQGFYRALQRLRIA